MDLLTIPNDVLSNLESGGFVISLKGHAGHSVAIDEVHEVYINKKSLTISRLYHRTVLFLPVRAEVMKNLESEVFQQNQNQSIHKHFS